jgi:Protein of unknown function (DUF3142)
MSAAIMRGHSSLEPKLAKLLLAALLVAPVSSCRPKTHAGNFKLPHIILWAWERPEDLEFLDTQEFGVAFLAQTLTLKGDAVVYTPRHQPLKVSPATKLIAVTRIEAQKQTGEKVTLNDRQREKLTGLILKTCELSNVSAIQVDFDAARSEREFYSKLLGDLRRRLPASIGLSMTALASFCVGDRWLNDLPVDEAVPMIFRMGLDDQPIKNLLASGEDFREPLCRKSYGIAVDERLQMKLDRSRRLYVFNTRAWTRNDVASLSGLEPPETIPAQRLDREAR